MAQIRIRRNSPYYSVHTHSRYSFNDALPSPEEIVEEAARLNYPALAITDHGNIAATVQLYKAARKRGIKPMPGTELYIVKTREDKKAKRYHGTLVAYTTQGYRNLVRISSLTHKNFYHRPIIDLADMAELHDEGYTEGLALTTGCYFGLVIQTLINDGYWAAKQLVATLAGWFDVYIEIQNHNIEQEPLSEREISLLLMRIARELNLPVVITQDSHYLHESDKPHHETLKQLVSWSDDPTDAEFPGDGFHMVDEKWMQEHHSPEVYEAGIAGLADLLSKYDMYIPEMEEYSYSVPQIYPNPDRELLERCSRRFVELNLGPKYSERLAEELDVIKAAGMANYMLMVAEVCDHMRDVAMFYQIRGSAAGSLVSWLLGISNVDPLKWNLRFDRFLSKDRTKPPDIDIDVETDRRKELMEWIGTRFAVIQICNWGTYSIEGDGENAKGSLRVKYISRVRKTMSSEAKNIWGDAPVQHKMALFRMADLKLISGPGVHAAALVVTSSQTVLESMVPMQWIASSRTMVTQYDMHDIEAIGLVKLDVLGVKTLSVLRQTILNLGRDPADGLDWIPLNDRRVYTMIGRGKTDGVFQLEGATSKRLVTRLRPTKISDVIAAMALFRPGVMNSGSTESYLNRKAKEEKVPKRHRLIEEATGFTYGILLYQDQVIEILRSMGMSADDLTAFLKAVKASNKGVNEARKVMDHYEPIVRQMCFDHGMDDDDIKWLWTALEAFAEYSFNRAHATVYGLTAYQCAWLAKNHPLEFHAALLAVAAGTDKEVPYKRVTKMRDIRILKPDINISGATYTVDKKKNCIRRGLMTIEGIGPKVAREIQANQPFKSLDDFCERVSPRIVTGIKKYRETGEPDVGKLQVLYESGVMKSLIGG